jgi:DNA-binding transcriptional MerR regulator
MGAKKGHKSSDLCRALDIQPYVLRYWETEFKALAAPSGSSGQRLYSDADVALVRRIKQLLYEEGYTIAGAKKKLESEPPEILDGAGETAHLFDAPSAIPAESSRSGDGNGGSSAAAPAAVLDTASSERIEQLRRGVERALADARALLKILEKHPR